MWNRSPFNEECYFRCVKLIPGIAVGIPVEFDGGDMLSDIVDLVFRVCFDSWLICWEEMRDGPPVDCSVHDLISRQWRVTVAQTHVNKREATIRILALVIKPYNAPVELGPACGVVILDCHQRGTDQRKEKEKKLAMVVVVAVEEGVRCPSSRVSVLTAGKVQGHGGDVKEVCIQSREERGQKVVQ